MKRAGPARPVSLLPAVAAAIAAAASTTTAATAIAAAAETRFARFGLVHLDVSALELALVELGDSLGGLVRVCHLDKAEAFRLARELVHDHRCALNLAGL